jgi:sporulation protein YlmC with PRC-barrel domain
LISLHPVLEKESSNEKTHLLVDRAFCHRDRANSGRPSAPSPPGVDRIWYYPERLRISAILYRPVLNNKGEEVGGVDDLLIDRRGKVERTILSVGRFLGIDGKLVAVLFKPLKITDLGIVYNVTKQELENLPALSKDGN